MKTSGELKHEFYEWLDKNPDKRASDWLRLKLAEHDREIIALIDEIKLKIVGYHDEDERQARWNVLTELKQKILETKK